MNETEDFLLIEKCRLEQEICVMCEKLQNAERTLASIDGRSHVDDRMSRGEIDPTKTGCHCCHRCATNTIRIDTDGLCQRCRAKGYRAKW